MYIYLDMYIIYRCNVALSGITSFSGSAIFAMPKSQTLMSTSLSGDTKRMFSGFRSSAHSIHLHMYV